MVSRDSAPTSRRGLRSLPPELRLQVYDNSISTYSRPDAKDIDQNDGSCHHKHSTLPLLLVSKQTSGEVLDLLQKRKEYVYRITPENAGFDDLALSCLRARKIKRDDYAEIPHLRIEIYPPHPDRLMRSIGDILDNLKDFCGRLAAVDRLQHVSIVFMENGNASWFTNGNLRISTNWSQVDDVTNLKHVLDFFAVLRNVTKATVELPGSVADNVPVYGQSLKEFKDRLEQSMMNRDPLEIGSVHLAIETPHNIVERFRESDELFEGRHYRAVRFQFRHLCAFWDATVTTSKQ